MRGSSMNFDGTSIFGEGSLEQVAIQAARNRDAEGESVSRKHFIDAYAEHLEALKYGRTTR